MPESTEKKPNRLWAIFLIALVAVIIVSASIAWMGYQPARPIEISLPTETRFQGNIKVSGSVTNPGIYPFSTDDTISSILQSAGGAASNANQTNLALTVSATGEPVSRQKININSAESWLLEALPGIGTTKAKAIVVYREQNGPFKQTSELMKVSGIGQSLYDQIKDLITVTG